MADTITGLVIGGVSLAGLFSTCIDFMDYVALKQNHGQDLEVALAKMSLLDFRLQVWGELVQVSEEGNELPALRSQWSQHSKVVGRCLAGIKGCFEDAAALEHRYGLKPVTFSDTGDQIRLRPPGGLAEIQEAFKITSRRRQKETTFAQRTWWAIHDKKKFDSLINDVGQMVDGLEKVSISLNILELQKKRYNEALSNLQNLESTNLLQNAEDSRRPNTSPNTNENDAGAQSFGHTYLHELIEERAKVLQGNLGSTPDDGYRNKYNTRRIGGDAHVLAGNASLEGAQMFFK